MIPVAMKFYGGIKMNWLTITLGILLIIVSVLVILAICLQETKQDGLQGLGSGSSDSFFSKNKGKTIEAKLIKITTILAIAFFVLVLCINLAVTYYK